MEWSYQLLDDHERRVFRAVSVFPGPFTLEAAEAVAGADAGAAVLRLVDCSLLNPPRPGPDGRSRYRMLETLRAYGNRLLAGTGEQEHRPPRWPCGRCGWLSRPPRACRPGTAEELDAARRLDAEDPTMRQVLAWAIACDAAAAVRLADALGGWWRLRRRLPGQYRLLSEIAGLAEPGSDRWCAIQGWLGWAAFLAFDRAGALDHFTAVRDAAGDWGPSRVLADALAGRAETLLSTGGLAEGAEDGRRSLAMARELGYPAGEGAALRMVAIAAFSSGDIERGVQLMRRQQLIAGVPGSIARAGSAVMIAALIESGDLAAAGTAGAVALAQCRDAGDLLNLPYMLGVMADLDVRAGHFQDAAAYLRDGLQIAVRPATCGMWRPTSCFSARCCALRPGATPKPLRCGLPRTRTPGSRGSLPRRPERACGRRR